MQTLRPDQTLVLTGVLQAASAGKRRILVYGPTGFGKTTVFAELAVRAQSKGSSCWVVVHREELASQAKQRLEGQGLRVGVLMGRARSTDESATVQVLGVATIAARLGKDEANRNLPPAPRVVFVDEAHHCVSPSWRAVVDWAVSQGAVVVLFSATPWAENGAGLGVADALVAGPSPAQLRDLGVLVEPEIYCGPTPDLTGLKSHGGDFAKAALAERTDLVVGDVVRTWQKLAPGLKTLCFAVNVAHSQRLVAEWAQAGIPSAHVDGTTPETERKDTFQKLASGDLVVVSNVGVVTEGFDCPAVECIVMARPTQSEKLFIQMAGRGLRSSPGKTKCLILDHGYNALRHGHPMMDRPISMEGRTRWTKVAEDSIVDESPHFRLCGSCMKACEMTCKVCPLCGKPLGIRPVKENKKVDLVKFTELDALQRDKVKVLERRNAWFRMELARGNKNPWTTTYAYASRYGIMPHEDRIFWTKQERQKYWAGRKHGRRRATA